MSEPTSQSVLEKIEFYFLALVFTLLGATIQTADFSGDPRLAVTLELAGWALLAISGIAGLSKLYWTVSILYVKERTQNFESLSRELKLAEARGVQEVRVAGNDKLMPVDEAFSKSEERKSGYDEMLSKLGRSHEIKHHLQWWSFIFGFIGVGVARGFAALC